MERNKIGCTKKENEDMVRINNFIYCLNAERIPAPDGNRDAVNAMGVLSILTPEFVPGTFSFSIVFSILGVDTINQNNKIRIIFGDTENHTLVDTGDIVLPPKPEGDDLELPIEYQGLDMSMDFRNVIFEKEGIYGTQIIWNGEKLGDCMIYVKGRR